MDGNVTEHYCFFKRVSRKDYDNDRDYGYDEAKQELRARDLARYGIQTFFVDEYEDITQILEQVEKTVKRNNVFISGSAAEYGEWTKEDALGLAGNIASALVKKDFKITSGFGLGLGSSVINAALTEIYRALLEMLVISPKKIGDSG